MGLKKFKKDYFYENLFDDLNFKKEKINKKKFIKSKFENSIFLETFLDNIEFWRTDFKNVSFVNCKFTSSVFYDLNLKNIKFINCEFKNCFLGHSEIQTKTFKNCNFKNLKFNTLLIHQDSGFDVGIDKTNFNDLFFYYDKKVYKLKKIISKISLVNIKKNNLKEFNILHNPNLNFIKCNLNTKQTNKKMTMSKKLFQHNKKFNNFHDELVYGKGYVVIENPFKTKDVDVAKKIIDNYKFKKSFNRLDKRANQFYLHNLFNINKIFQKLLPKNKNLEVIKKILGQGMQCGFYSANISKPGARGQLFHIDYPYPTIKTIDGKLNGDFANYPVNIQSLFYLQNTKNINGATSFVPYSQNLNLNPSKLKIFINEKINKLCFEHKNKLYSMNYVNFEFKKNTMVIFNGLAWHRGGFNYSQNQNRTALNAQWIPSHILPMHKFKNKKKNKRYIFPYVNNQNYPIKV